MPIIILVEPFIRHYTGSIFQLNDAIGDSGWDEDIRVRDRQPCHDKRVYNLPDNGKGIGCELPIDYTVLCPEDVFKDEDLKSGPCRITSVSEGLEKQNNDPWYAEPLPLGRGKLLLKDACHYEKNVVENEDIIHPGITRLMITNLVSNETMTITNTIQDKLRLDLSSFNPGFYNIALYYDADVRHFFTIMKCFPMVVKFADYSNKYLISRTLW